MAEKNDNDKLLEVLFPEEWYTKVTTAINFAVNSLRYTGLNAISLAKVIIDYNIEKRLDEVLQESTDVLLPKMLDWSKIKIDDAFTAFNALLETCEIYPRLKKYSVKIKFSENKELYNCFLLWKEMCNEKYPKLSLRIRSTTKSYVVTLEIQKAKQSK